MYYYCCQLQPPLRSMNIASALTSDLSENKIATPQSVRRLALQSRPISHTLHRLAEAVNLRPENVRITPTASIAHAGSPVLLLIQNNFKSLHKKHTYWYARSVSLAQELTAVGRDWDLGRKSGEGSPGPFFSSRMLEFHFFSTTNKCSSSFLFINAP